MSNLGNKLKSGFYAFPSIEGEYLSQLLEQEDGKAAYFDPTCGEGIILKQLKLNMLCNDKSKIKTYGVELDDARAEIAKENLNKVVKSPVESMVIENDFFNFVFLNPPYDNTIKGAEDYKSERKEFIELKRGTRYLMAGGILIYVIPSYRMAEKRIARYLSMNYENVEVMKLGEENYPIFKQCVFIGRKKKAVAKIVDESTYHMLMQLSCENFIKTEILTIEELVRKKKKWIIPCTANNVPKIFYSKMEDKTEYYEAFKNSSGFQQFMERTKPKELSFKEKPIMPINNGMLALIVSTGGVNGLLGQGETLHLLQGKENVGEEIEREVYYHEKGGTTTKEITRTKRSVSIKVVTPTGKIIKFV